MFSFAKRSPRRTGDGDDALAQLILAAREDAAFRARLVFVLRLPGPQRRALIQTAVAEMRMRGEPTDAQEAFSALAADDAASLALRLLDSL